MKNIVICCDGTGNEISENISNVLKLYRCLRKTEKTTPHQAVFYDPGVGTLAQPDTWHRFKANFNLVLGLATGYGLDDNVLSAYSFLVHNYEDGDRIFLFGFSRGAYTVRVLAGLIHKIGLISPDQVNLAGSGLIAYKQYSSSTPKAGRGLVSETSDEDGPLPADRFDLAAQFARITSTRWPTIHFVGVWDTVASVIVPRADRFFIGFSLEELAFTIANPSVRIFRQAAAIDEKRCMFRLKAWSDPQTFKHNRFNDSRAEPQDIRQVWFAGVHCDVGGGYPEKDAALSKYPLLWMIDEAVAAGLSVNPRTVNQLAWGVQRKNSPFSYVAPSIRGILHDSMTPAWRLLEFLPKSATYKEWPQRQVHFGCYIPDGEPRFIPDGAHIHESVLMRIAEIRDYRPVNLPASYERVALPVKGDG
jgi:uncharacterized protein (DUF2235 family)